MVSYESTINYYNSKKIKILNLSFKRVWISGKQKL